MGESPAERDLAVPGFGMLFWWNQCARLPWLGAPCPGQTGTLVVPGLQKRGMRWLQPPRAALQPVLWGDMYQRKAGSVENPISEHQDLASSASSFPSTESGPCLKLSAFAGKYSLSGAQEDRALITD